MTLPGGQLRLKHFCVYLLAGALAAPAQQRTSPVNQLVDVKETLKISVTEGEGAKNSVRSRTGTAPVVVVTDETDKPVSGAEVVFQLPMVGPSGVFNGWLKTQTVRTDEQGRAAATGYAPNAETGRFNIKVTATSGAQKGSAVIAQSNIEGSTTSGSQSRTPWKLIGIIGGAALVGGIIAATTGGDNGAVAVNPTAVTVTPGTITVAPPR
jgi:hypothetical protein